MGETRIIFETESAWEHHLAEHERQVREQVAREIEALEGNPLLKGLVDLSPSAQATIEYAAATARGEDQ